jgi:hypothetical protein
MFYFENLVVQTSRDDNRLLNYLLIRGVMNEIPEQLRPKSKHSSNMGVKMMLTKSSGDPKFLYVRIPNESENDYVTVLNFSLIRGASV